MLMYRLRWLVELHFSLWIISCILVSMFTEWNAPAWSVGWLLTWSIVPIGIIGTLDLLVVCYFVRQFEMEHPWSKSWNLYRRGAGWGNLYRRVQAERKHKTALWKFEKMIREELAETIEFLPAITATRIRHLLDNGELHHAWRELKKQWKRLDQKDSWTDRQMNRLDQGVNERGRLLLTRAKALGMEEVAVMQLFHDNGDDIDRLASVIETMERRNTLAKRATELDCLHLVHEHLEREDEKGAEDVITKVEKLLRDSGEFKLTRKVPELIAKGNIAGAEAAVREARAKAELERRFQSSADRIRALDPGKAQDDLWRQMKALKRLTSGTRDYRKAEHDFERALANAERYGTLTEPPN